jgi:hypothetical protein
MEVMQCPECGKPLDYVPNGMGHIMHSHPLEVGCIWNVMVGHDATKHELIETWKELGGPMMEDED